MFYIENEAGFPGDIGWVKILTPSLENLIKNEYLLGKPNSVGEAR